LGGRAAAARWAAALRAVLATGAPAPRTLDVRVGRGEDEPPLDLAITTSGTSTTELAVAQVPMAVFYRASPLARLAARCLVTSPWIAMPNLLSGRPVVSERLVGGRGAQAIARDALALLDDPARWRATRDALGAVRAALVRPSVADRVARAVLAVTPSRLPPPA
jgi:lipid-A-disaccharide synthase